MKNQPTFYKVDKKFLFSPEIGLGELFHVELLICERGQMDITNGGKHFTWNKQTRPRLVNNTNTVSAQNKI